MILTNYTAGLASHGPARYPAAEDEVWTYYPDDKPVSLTIHLNILDVVKRPLHLQCAVQKQYLSEPARPYLPLHASNPMTRLHSIACSGPVLLLVLPSKTTLRSQHAASDHKMLLRRYDHTLEVTHVWPWLPLWLTRPCWHGAKPTLSGFLWVMTTPSSLLKPLGRSPAAWTRRRPFFSQVPL